MGTDNKESYTHNIRLVVISTRWLQIIKSHTQYSIMYGLLDGDKYQVLTDNKESYTHYIMVSGLLDGDKYQVVTDNRESYTYNISLSVWMAGD